MNHPEKSQMSMNANLQLSLRLPGESRKKFLLSFCRLKRTPEKLEDTLKVYSTQPT